MTRREVEIASLIAGGKTYREIATMLGISEKTVETHRENLRKKLGAVNTVHAIALMFRGGLIQ